MNNCNDCPSKEQPDCCHARPEEVQSASAEDRAWNRDFAVVELRQRQREAKREQQDSPLHKANQCSFGLLAGMKIGE